MVIRDQDLLYPPPPAGNISWMYPWHSFLRDMFDLLTNFTFKVMFGRYVFDIEKVEIELAKYFPANSTVYTDSGRSAIFLSLKSLGIGEGDEVILSTFNCPSVIDPIISCGATPILVDCDKNCRIDIEAIKKAITKKTKAIILTNIYGILDDEVLVRKVIRNTSVTIINDLSQSLIVPKLNPKFFKNDQVYIFSFGPQKQLYCFGGGAIFCSNPTILHVKKLSTYSLNTSDYSLIIVGLKRIHYFLTLSIYAYAKPLAILLKRTKLLVNFSSRKSISKPSVTKNISVASFTSIQKNVLLRKLKVYKKYSEGNHANRETILSLLSDNRKLKIVQGEALNPSYTTIVLNVPRFTVSDYLSSVKVPTVWNYIPLHLLPRYEQYKKHQYPTADKVWKKVLSLPFRYPMKGTDLNKVVRSLQYAIDH